MSKHILHPSIAMTVSNARPHHAAPPSYIQKSQLILPFSLEIRADEPSIKNSSPVLFFSPTSSSTLWPHWRYVNFHRTFVATGFDSLSSSSYHLQGCRTWYLLCSEVVILEYTLGVLIIWNITPVPLPVLVPVLVSVPVPVSLVVTLHLLALCWVRHSANLLPCHSSLFSTRCKWRWPKKASVCHASNKFLVQFDVAGAETHASPLWFPRSALASELNLSVPCLSNDGLWSWIGAKMIKIGPFEIS